MNKKNKAQSNQFYFFFNSFMKESKSTTHKNNAIQI